MEKLKLTERITVTIFTTDIITFETLVREKTIGEMYIRKQNMISVSRSPKSIL